MLAINMQGLLINKGIVKLVIYMQGPLIRYSETNTMMVICKDP